MYSTLPHNFSNLGELKMRGLEVVEAPPNPSPFFLKKTFKQDN